MRTKKEQALIAALEGAAVERGFELVDVELSGASAGRIVRVYLDRPAEAGALSIDALAEANTWVAPLVEDCNPVTGRYSLEVSSPGIDRPLRTLAHFARFAGEEVQLKTEPIDRRGSWTGELAGVEGADGASAGASASADGADGRADGAGASADAPQDSNGISEQALVLVHIEGVLHRIPFEKIQKARVKGRIDFSRAAQLEADADGTADDDGTAADGGTDDDTAVAADATAENNYDHDGTDGRNQDVI